MGLAKIPVALGFEDLEKGHFPYKFNTRVNEYYVGPYPDPYFYGYDRMSESGEIYGMVPDRLPESPSLPLIFPC